MSPRCDLQGDKPEEELELEIHHPILEYSGGAREQQRRKKRRERDSESEEPSYCKLVHYPVLELIHNLNLYYLHLLPGLRAEVVTWRPYVNRRSPAFASPWMILRPPSFPLLSDDDDDPPPDDSSRCHTTTILPTLLGSLYTAGEVRNGQFGCLDDSTPAATRRRFYTPRPLHCDGDFASP